MSREERAGVLAFATGRSRLPAPRVSLGGGGLMRQPHVLRLDVRRGGSDTSLPTASTCSWALHLPAVMEPECMARALRVAVQFSGTIDGDRGTSGGSSLLQLLDAAADGMGLDLTASAPGGNAWLLQPLWPDAPDVVEVEEAEASTSDGAGRGSAAVDDEPDGDSSDEERLEPWQVEHLLEQFFEWRDDSEHGAVRDSVQVTMTEAAAEVRTRDGLFQLIEAQGDEMLESWEHFTEEMADALDREDARESQGEGDEGPNPENCRQQ